MGSDPIRAHPPGRGCGITGGRCLLLVDIENLCGGSDRVAASQSEVQQQLSQICDTSLTTITVVAHGRQVRWRAPLLPFDWPGARFLLGAGIDGADRRLLAVLQTEPLASRCERVVLASGDGIFADAVRRLVLEGVDVSVVARRGTIARRLERAATETIELPLGGVPESVAA